MFLEKFAVTNLCGDTFSVLPVGLYGTLSLYVILRSDNFSQLP